MSDFINKVFTAVAHPGSEIKPDLAHNASHGASLEEHNPETNALKRIISPETTKQIKSQGNVGIVGMEGGLRDKAIEQQERVAERSRLSQSGMFEPHVKHEVMTNYTQEHREVADGRDIVFGHGDGSMLGKSSFESDRSADSADNERVV